MRLNEREELAVRDDIGEFESLVVNPMVGLLEKDAIILEDTVGVWPTTYTSGQKRSRSRSLL